MKTVSPTAISHWNNGGHRALTTPRAILGATLSHKQNAIVLLADDLGYYDLGCYGQK